MAEMQKQGIPVDPNMFGNNVPFNGAPGSSSAQRYDQEADYAESAPQQALKEYAMENVVDEDHPLYQEQVKQATQGADHTRGESSVPGGPYPDEYGGEIDQSQNEAGPNQPF